MRKKKILIVSKSKNYLFALGVSNLLSKQGNSVSLASSLFQADDWIKKKGSKYFDRQIDL